MPLSPLEYLKHIQDEINFLMENREKLHEEDFLSNSVLQRAFVRSLEIFGEATKQIDPAYKERFPEVPWKSMAQMRDKLIHHYFGIENFSTKLIGQTDPNYYCHRTLPPYQT